MSQSGHIFSLFSNLWFYIGSGDETTDIEHITKIKHIHGITKAINLDTKTAFWSNQRCQDQNISAETPHSLRVKVTPERLKGFSDRFLGEQPALAETAQEDFIVKRRDGLYAYQLAAAIDDAKPSFTHIVRGADLLESTHRQRWIQHLLGLESPSYAHVAILVDEAGNKLSKQTGAPPLDNRQPVCYN